ncbi:MAG: arsenate reductase [Burkholderiaceae bacterium]|nr:arsenate reductase [Xylophilus sp.]MBP6558676.1 arsenate reductase [Burkholderiaceae bacterium]MBP6617329.1 arsenate reductase [Burkholderiaceae bacterium]MBP6651135.1 arsenate reductase [Xylophilus sp.]MBP7419692.1 arsenate reductase [Burkholderiaceae bacterium]
MNTPPITVFGIPNCDTVKKARAWLDAAGLPYHFHDFKKHGVPPDLLAQWTDAVGWEKLLNRKGTTWRTLDAATQASVTDAASAQAVMQTHASVVKRPVVQWSADSSNITVGFDAAAWAARAA